MYELRFKFHWTLSDVRINNIHALVKIMALRLPDDKPLSETMVFSFLNAYMRHSASMSSV